MRSTSTLFSLHGRKTIDSSDAIWGDHEIASAISLSVDMALPGLIGLECMVQDGIVILRGRVDTSAGHERLLAIAADTPGVRHVIDRLAAPSQGLRRAA